MPQRELFFSSNSIDWDLHRQGSIDQERHKQKVKEAIKDNLKDIISQENIITSDGQRIVKVPVKGLELPRFRYDYKKRDHAGQGQGGTNVGDIIAEEPNGSGPGKGKRAGSEPGVDYYEAEISIDDLADMLFEDLGLPNLQPKKRQEVETENVEYKDVRKKGPMSNLDKKRTILENIKRNALSGDPKFYGITSEDLRFKTWKPTVRQTSNAAIIAMRDVSGSMGEFEKYITRSVYFWMIRFLRKKYQNVRMVFLTHHAEAKEVDEETFFRLGESGGTKVSTAYKLAAQIIDERFDPERWNTYAFHFSDGDNWGDADNRLCLEAANKLLAKVNLFGYGEIAEGRLSLTSTLMETLKTIDSPKFVPCSISSKKDVYGVLDKFFGREIREGVLNRA